MYSVSIAEIVERIGQEEPVGELRGRSECLQNVCEDEHEEDPGRYEESVDEGHGSEADMRFELDGEHNEDDGYEQIPAESECCSESILVGNEEFIPPKSQAVNAAELKERHHSGWEKMTEAESQAMVSQVVPEIIHDNSKEACKGDIHPAAGGEDERAALTESHVVELQMFGIMYPSLTKRFI